MKGIDIKRIFGGVRGILNDDTRIKNDTDYELIRTENSLKICEIIEVITIKTEKNEN